MTAKDIDVDRWLREIPAVGRDVLIARLKALAERLRQLEADNAQMNENLSHVQARCTELLTEARAARAQKTEPHP